MNYDQFVGQVQSRARLGSTGETVRAIRATLEALGQRLAGNEAQHLAAQLPEEVGYYLKQAEAKGERFGLREFFERVSQHERQDLPEATHHARAVISVVCEAITPGELGHLRAQLPEEFNPLFQAAEQVKQGTA
jgi:uncharacterized protein (DUF2267 family)